LPAPTQLIVKSFRDRWHLAAEVEAYRRMNSIQGTVVPTFYGLANVEVLEYFAFTSGSRPDHIDFDEDGLPITHDDTRLPSVVLEYIVGDPLDTHKSDRSQLPILAKALEEYAKLLSGFGIAQMDPKLDGVIVTKRSPDLTIRLIDFSHVDFDM
jgi:hypothetical protein